MTDITQRGQLTKDDSGFSVGWKYSLSAATGATAIKTTPGVLHCITFNKPVATTVVNVYDASAATTGAAILGITVPSSPQPVTLFYDVVCGTGITVEHTTAASNITISYI